MSVYFVKPHGWKYDFMYKRQRYQSNFYDKKKDAISAQEIKRHNVKMGIGIKGPRQTKDIASPIEKSLQDFIDKYQEISKNPEYTLPIIFDMLMNDMRLPYSFKEVLKMARNYNKTKITIPAKLRAKVLKRDNYTCRMCGAQAPDAQIEVDHIIPLSRGGLTEERNLRALCKSCNLGKADLPFNIGG